MSGAEAIAVVGLISSVIAIIETSRDLYDAASDAKGLHEAFRMVAKNVPLVLNILRDCKRIQEAAEQQWRDSTDAALRKQLEESAEGVRDVMEACEEDAKQLKEIFEKVIPGGDANWVERYRKAVSSVMPQKKRKVEDLMRDILEKLQLLHTNQFYKTVAEKRSADVTEAIEQLSQVPSSLPDEEGRFSHSGTGPMNVNTGSGEQRNFNQSGGVSNKQYNAETMHFGNS